MRKSILAFTSLALITLFMSACNVEQIKIDSAAKALDKAETGMSEMTEEEWIDFEHAFEELEHDLSINKRHYTAEQIKEIRKLQGRYAALMLKKGFQDTKDIIRDFGSQLEGFIEGISQDTIKRPSNK
jgi:hypothetical protein